MALKRLDDGEIERQLIFDSDSDLVRRCAAIKIPEILE
jgi:hypothetical protein